MLNILKIFRRKDTQIINKLQQEIFQLKEIIDNFPGDVYWKNRKGVWLGVNKRGSESLKKMGFLSDSHDVIGKTDQQLFGKQTADIYRKNDFIVMNEDREVSIEEETMLPSGKYVIKSSTKKPLYNEHQEIVGIIGSSMDITAQKEAEKLRLENAEQKIKIGEQEKFYKVASQLSHDMRSPLSALKILHEQIAPKLTENERVMQRNALTRFTDILNSGFIRYKPDEKRVYSQSQEFEEKEYFLVSAALEQILAEKRLEYQHQSVIFDMNFDSSALFAFFYVKLSSFKRMISNLINNAIDAFDNKPGKIMIHLKADGKQVHIILEDNGKGMPDLVREKILNNIAITSGKEHGNGIGYVQIRDTLQEHNASLSIDSELNVGTKIQLTFQRMPAPAWALDSIILHPSDCVIVVDDNPSIHDAWNAHFSSNVPAIRSLKHFQQGKEAIQFIKNLSVEEKDLVFLLTDYELLGQPVNGLDIVEQTQVKRAILVTSHSDEEQVRERALSLNVRILPKLLASSIPILCENNSEHFALSSSAEIVIIDDDKIIRDAITLCAFSKRKVHTYDDPYIFLNDISMYAMNTLFLIDYNFKNAEINGIDIAEKLNSLGYMSLYLFSGENIESNQIPSYLSIIRKTDIDKLMMLGE